MNDSSMADSMNVKHSVQCPGAGFIPIVRVRLRITLYLCIPVVVLEHRLYFCFSLNIKTVKNFLLNKLYSLF